MTNHDLAISFVERFCAGDVEGLVLLLAKDLRFRGPFHQFDSRDAYVSCLKDNPPTRSRFHVLSVTEDDDHVAVFYEYQKTDETVMLAQLFKCEDGKITEILLVFDGRGIESK
ncbi:nuclear transport factor 2 family protein [Gimesia aquarii]|uniref:SnoaL-like domain protein n=1 Tax=Gimesia aquarii TaxID=2527964 RepID=A0A517VQL7_9PLAN|nr:nuclear transport factor 2 family protein [Gimesia aquarii]QDT95249.1 SnoaL-like domain protein [Gimesia aquarii]